MRVHILMHIQENSCAHNVSAGSWRSSARYRGGTKRNNNWPDIVNRLADLCARAQQEKKKFCDRVSSVPQECANRRMDGCTICTARFQH